MLLNRPDFTKNGHVLEWFAPKNKGSDRQLTTWGVAIILVLENFGEVRDHHKSLGWYRGPPRWRICWNRLKSAVLKVLGPIFQLRGHGTSAGGDCYSRTPPQMIRNQSVFGRNNKSDSATSYFLVQIQFWCADFLAQKNTCPPAPAPPHQLNFKN